MIEKQTNEPTAPYDKCHMEQGKINDTITYDGAKSGYGPNAVPWAISIIAQANPDGSLTCSESQHQLWCNCLASSQIMSGRTS